MPIECVWDYPRPPRLELSSSRIRVRHAGHLLADTSTALRILETSHPPVYYLPRSAFSAGLLVQSTRRASFCEFKGSATYWNLLVPQPDAAPILLPDAAWSYEAPSNLYRNFAGHIAIYAGRVDECWIDDERVTAQPGDFYGGWITSNVRGPFKGPPGTRHW